MLSVPHQNSDTLHRTETVADLRNAQLQRQQGEQAHAHAVQKAIDEHRSTEVEKSRLIDAHTEQFPEHQQEQQQGQKKRRKAEESAKQGVPPLRNLGSGHVDITA